MSVKNLGFPLPVKIEEDQKLFIDLDTEGNSPEDIVIEWHLEIRRSFGSYSAASGEIKLISIMKEYITAITERAIHFEDIARLQDMVDNHMEHIYWFYRDSDVCFSDMYLEYMEHILTFYVNLTLRVLLALKKKVKVTQKKVNDMSQKVIKRLSFYLLKSEYHIFHVLIRQTTTLVDGMIKDVMNILNSNICKQMFRNLYLHFLVLTPVSDMSDEAFCRAYILFENWKAFEDYKQNEKIEECVKNIFNRDMETIRENEFLRKILMPQTSIMSELMKVMGCDPSITKAYFDYIKSKQKGEEEILDDIGKLALEDALLSETEGTDEDDYETAYMEIFNKIMGNTKYDLNDIVLDTRNCKDEENLQVQGETSVNDETEILVLDTDSDSDVEIISIVPSANSTRQASNPTRRSRNPVANVPTTTSFLESISIEVDTSRRKYGFRTLGNFDNVPPKTTTQVNQDTPGDKSSASGSTEDQDSDLEVIMDKPTETCLIIDDNVLTDNNSRDEDPSTIESHSIIPPNGLEKYMATTDNVTSTLLGDPNLLITNVSDDLSEIPKELEISRSQSTSNVSSSENNTTINPSKIVVVSSTSNKNEEDSTSQPMKESPVVQEVLPILKNSPVPIATQTNGIVNHVCTCSQLLKAPVLTNKEHVDLSDVLSSISSTTENVKAPVQTDASLDENSKNDEVEANPISNNTTDKTVFNDEVELNQTVEGASSTTEVKINFEKTSVDNCSPIETDDHLDTSGKQTEDQLVPDEPITNKNSNEVELTGAVKCTENTPIESSVVTENCKTQQADNAESIPIEIHLGALSITSELITEHIPRPKNGCVIPSVEVNECRRNGTLTKDLKECQMRDRTLKYDKEPKVLKCRTELVLNELTRCESGCGKDETTISHNKNDEKGYISSNIDQHTNKQFEAVTPLDTGQDSFAQPLDTGQFDANSPASPENIEINLKSPCNKSVVKMLQTASEPLLRKAQHGEFGYPTPPGSEEERDKDTDEQTKLIYSNILPTQRFNVDENVDPHEFETEQMSQTPYKELAPNNVQKDNFLSEVVDREINIIDIQPVERLTENTEKEDASSSLGKSYEQIVKDAVGSQNSTEDEDADETQINSENYNRDPEQNMSFEEMEQFLKKYDEDYPQSNRKKRKRPREKTIFEDKSRKNSFVRSPKRVKINAKPETHFITTSYDEDSKDDIWTKKDSNDYDSCSSSDNEEMGSNRPRGKAKRRPSPMPLSKYLSKRNGTTTHIPLSGTLSPDKPPPLKGILKRIEQKHTYHPLHPMDDEPETVVIVLHQREVGRGKRGSVEVKVYRKSFSAFQIPFDDHKLCHHSFVKLERQPIGNLGFAGEVSCRTRYFEEEMFNQAEKPMYKIVFDKKTHQLNSNDRKYYCDPSIASNSSAYSKPKSTLFENNQGTVNLSTEIAFIQTSEPVESIAEPTIQAPISPPCFSPSSNSSSEFSDPTNFIPYQDIERALQVVEPDKPEQDAPGYSLECHDSNDSLEKSLVDRIALETIELLSNNADFHKMLRDLNGEILIENVPLIGIGEPSNIDNVAVLPETPSNNDDLVSNLNSDEQLLKKVCQELESKSLVDNLTGDTPNQIALTESFLKVDVRDNCPEESSLIVEMNEQEIKANNTEVKSDKISYQEGQEFLTIPNNSFSLHSAVENSSLISATCSETNFSVLNAPSGSTRYSSPMISPVPNSLNQGTFPSVPDLTFTNSNNLHSNFPASSSPTFVSKVSPIVSPVLSFHQDPYSSISHFSINPTTMPETNLSSLKSTSVRNSPVSNLHQQTFSAITSLPLIHSETDFLNSAPSLRISNPPISPIPNALQETYSSIPNSSLIHSGYSEIRKTVASPLHVYSTSTSPHQTIPSNIEMKSFPPDPTIALSVYPEGSLRSAPSTFLSYTQSNSTISTSPLSYSNDIDTTSYVHNLPLSPTYTETNCLISKIPLAHSYTEKKGIVPSSPSTVPSYLKTNDPTLNTQSAHTYLESTSLSIIPSTSTYAPNSEIPSSFPPFINSSTCNLPQTTIPHTKTDRVKRRLPKEVLTISQLNEPKSSNIKMNSSIYSTISKEFAQIRTDIGQQISSPDPHLELTDQLYRNNQSRDPRLGQPLICVPPPFIQNMSSSSSSFMIKLTILPDTLRELIYKRSLFTKNKCFPQKNKDKIPNVHIIRSVDKYVTKSEDTNSEHSHYSLQKFADTMSSLETPKDVADSSTSLNAPKIVTDDAMFLETSKNLVDSTAFLNTLTVVSDNATFSEGSRNILDSAATLGVNKNVAGVTTFLETPKNDSNPLSFLESSVNVVYSETYLGTSKNDLVATFLEAPKNDSNTVSFLESSVNVVYTETSLGTSKNDLVPTFLEAPKNDSNPVSFLESSVDVVCSETSLDTPKNDVDRATILVTPEDVTNAAGTCLEAPKNDTDITSFLETPMKVADSAVSLRTSRNYLDAKSKKVTDALISSATPEDVFVVPKSKVSRNSPQSITITSQNIATEQGNKQIKSKTGRKRGRPPKNAKSLSAKNSNNDTHDYIPPVPKNIPPDSVHVKTNNYNERVPPLYHPDASTRSYPATRNATQLRVEPLKIVKDPNSKKGYNKVVKVNSRAHTRTPPLPMPVPETYNFSTDTYKKDVFNVKPPENSENDVEFETHLPLKKRKLSMPVPYPAQTQPTTLANVPRSRDKKEEISYPATPMLSIADVYMQPRTFKTPAEKKQLPPESSNTVPIRYKPPPVPDNQFNCNFTPAIYGYRKCPYSVELDCNSYCPPPVLFPPESFNHTN